MDRSQKRFLAKEVADEIIMDSDSGEESEEEDDDSDGDFNSVIKHLLTHTVPKFYWNPCINKHIVKHNPFGVSDQ